MVTGKNGVLFLKENVKTEKSTSIYGTPFTGRDLILVLIDKSSF